MLSGEGVPNWRLGREPCNFNIQGENGVNDEGLRPSALSRARCGGDLHFIACRIEGHVRIKLTVRPGRAPTRPTKARGGLLQMSSPSLAV